MASTSRVSCHPPPLHAAAKTQETQHEAFYRKHCRRIYSLALWMTGNESAAKQLAVRSFVRAFASRNPLGTAEIDNAFLDEARKLSPLEMVVPAGRSGPGHTRIRASMKRVHLESAVLELPAIERLIFLLHDVEEYEDVQIAHLLGISEHEVRFGLHIARLRIRSLMARIRA